MGGGTDRVGGGLLPVIPEPLRSLGFGDLLGGGPRVTWAPVPGSVSEDRPPLTLGYLLSEGHSSTAGPNPMVLPGVGTVPGSAGGWSGSPAFTGKDKDTHLPGCRLSPAQGHRLQLPQVREGSGGLPWENNGHHVMGMMARDHSRGTCPALATGPTYLPPGAGPPAAAPGAPPATL